MDCDYREYGADPFATLQKKLQLSSSTMGELPSSVHDPAAQPDCNKAAEEAPIFLT
jgi:hypothetical protein